MLSGIVRLLFRIKVIGRENEPDEGGFVVCANHIAATDPIMICYAFKKHQIRYMAKKVKNIWKYFPFSTIYLLTKKIVVI